MIRESYLKNRFYVYYKMMLRILYYYVLVFLFSVLYGKCIMEFGVKKIVIIEYIKKYFFFYGEI